MIGGGGRADRLTETDGPTETDDVAEADDRHRSCNPISKVLSPRGGVT